MMKFQTILLSTLLLGLLACSQKKAEAPAEEAATQPTPPAPPAQVPVEKVEPAAKPTAEGVHFLNLADGAEVKTEFQASFTVGGKTIRPAGEAPDEKTTGHHHVIIDGAAIPEGTVIPMDDKHLHFGKGQTAAKLQLTPGAHTLTLQFADGAHRSYGPKWAQTIKVNVKAVAPDAPQEPAAQEKAPEQPAQEKAPASPGDAKK